MSSQHSGRAFYAGLLEALTHVIGSAKGYLRDHGPRVGMLAGQIGGAMGLSRRRVSELLYASILSDMGMVGLAEDAWENPVAHLPPEVLARVRRHPVRSQARVRDIPHLEGLAGLVRHHHEWWDGSGYPDGLVHENIPVGARILRLADTVTALGQWRPHRPALDPEAIAREVQQGTGREFGPQVAQAFLDLHDAGDILPFDPVTFRRAVAQASEHLIPARVSPLSSDHLLTILSNLIDAKDPYTAGHSRRVAALAVALAAQLGMSDHLKGTLWAGGYLHDLGKLSVPVRILAKRGRLTPEEFQRVKAHPTDGAAILQEIPSLRHLTTGARYHHERWDGSGYPEGLKGDHIPLVGQVLAVCDAYDAMTSVRAYRSGRTHADAMDEMARFSGVHFNPRLVRAFMALPEPLFDMVRAESNRTAVLARLPREPRSLWAPRTRVLVPDAPAPDALAAS